MIGDSSNIKIEVKEKHSRVVALYDVVVWPMTKLSHPNFVRGDVIAVRLHGKPWGVKERKQFIIYTIEMTAEEAATLADPLEDQAGKVIHKRRYQFKLENLDIDTEAMQDANIDYQPFLDGKIKLNLSTAKKEALFYCKKRGIFKYGV